MIDSFGLISQKASLAISFFSHGEDVPRAAQVCDNSNLYKFPSALSCCENETTRECSRMEINR